MPPLARARRTAATLALTAASGGPLAAQATTQASTQAAVPPAGPAWIAGGSTLADFRVALDSTVAHGGRRSVRIASVGDTIEGFVAVSTTVPAGEFRGRRARLSGHLRGAALRGDGGALWLRADAGSRSVAFTNSQARPVLGTADWTRVEIEIDVPASATTLLFGILSAGPGTLWADDLVLDAPNDGVVTLKERRAFDFEDVRLVVPPTVAILREAPRALEGRGLDNVVAFTRLLGYVRYFHPADEALRVNWDDFTVRGLRAVERAPTADSLARTLRALFSAVAPTVAVFRTGGPAPAPLAALRAGGATAGVIAWRHLGVGLESPRSGSNIYSSVRVRLPVPTPGATIGPEQLGLGRGATQVQRVAVPDPREPARVDLGAGVSAAVPLAVYTTLATLPDSLTKARPAPPTALLSPRDRATRMAAVITTWNVMQHFYPYFDVVRADWPAALRRALAGAAADGDRADFQATMERLVAALRDGHGSVSGGPRMPALPLTLELVEGQVAVVAVGDSAAPADVRVGDVVLAVDGVPADAALRAWEERISGSTPQWIRYVALNRLGSGPAGTSATVRLRRAADPSAPARDVRLPRGTPAALPLVGLPAKVAELRPGVMYVDLDRITDADFDAALPQLQKATGIVFDMRGYPGTVSTPRILAHLTDTIIRSARFEVPLVMRPDRAGMQFTDGGWPVTPRTPRLTAKIAFLTGGGAISYAETTMGIVEAFRLGEIVGEATAGTNGNVNPFMLPGGYSVSWTGMRVRKHDGSRHHGVGIAPTVPARRTIRGVAAGRDEVLDRAVDVVTGVRVVH
jgi:C-terminal processing protease CtpA/Prc